MGGIFGSEKMAKKYDEKIPVEQINGQTLGRQLTSKCGEEEQWPELDAPGKTTLRFLKYAISYVPSALEVGADLNNTSFIFNQPGREFVITSGDGDWEFYFYQDEKGNIVGKKIPQPPSIWTEFKRFASSVLEVVQEMFSKAILDYLTTMFADLFKPAATVIRQQITSIVTDIFCFLKQSMAWFCTEVLQAIASRLPALVSTVVSYINYGSGLFFIPWIIAQFN